MGLKRVLRIPNGSSGDPKVVLGVQKSPNGVHIGSKLCPKGSKEVPRVQNGSKGVVKGKIP